MIYHLLLTAGTKLVSKNKIKLYGNYVQDDYENRANRPARKDSPDVESPNRSRNHIINPSPMWRALTVVATITIVATVTVL